MARFLAAVAGICFLTALRPAVAADEPKVEGNWQGKLEPAPGTSLRLVIHITREGNGPRKATFDSLDQGANDIPFDSVVVEGEKLRLEAKGIGARYEGTIAKDGKSIDGTWQQGGGRLALKLMPQGQVAEVAIPKALAGHWEGTLTLNGTLELRLVFHLTNDKAGKPHPVMDSPDQGAMGIGVTDLQLKGDDVTIAVGSIGGKFVGKRIERGDALEGQWLQGPQKLPITLKRTEAPKEARRPQMPKPPFPYRSEEVAYDNPTAKIRLAGTLTTPPGDGPFPAALLITGSGAQDRDESLMGHKPFYVLSDALTRRGIAVLRVDDRGVGKSTGDMAKATSEDFAGDVAAGVAFLKARKEVDAKKIGLIGHSEGGLIAPMVAARSKDVAYIVLLAGTGVPGDEILLLQGRLIAAAGGAKPEDLEKLETVQKALFAAMRSATDETAVAARMEAAIDELARKGAGGAGKADEDEGTRKALEAQAQIMRSPWFRYFLTYDPRPTLAKVKCPVLAINGEKDLQVPPKANLPEIEKALKAGGNSDVTVRELPELNHLFQHAKTGSPIEYGRIEETFAPEALKLVGDWILEHTN